MNPKFRRPNTAQPTHSAQFVKKTSAKLADSLSPNLTKPEAYPISRSHRESDLLLVLISRKERRSPL